jgi:chemotaxis protein MotA
MIALIGLAVVVASVIGGFTLAGGKLAALFHISEFIVILGTAAGTVLISTPAGVLRSLSGKLPRIIQPSPFGRALYLDTLKMMYELFQVARRDGLVAIEAHIEAPDKSTLFRKYPAVLRQHHAITFLCDSLRIVLVGSVPPHDLDALMDSEIEVHHEQEAMPVSTMQKVGDSLPGIGIVAAVLGIVVTMQAIAGPTEQIGEHVAAALTGTFLGVLTAYGFANPIASGLEHVNAAEARIYHVIKAGVVAFAKGFSPIIAAEFGRRAIFQEVRPSFVEMESACKTLKAKAGAEG